MSPELILDPDPCGGSAPQNRNAAVHFVNVVVEGCLPSPLQSERKRVCT